MANILLEIPLSDIESDPNQPRKDFNEEALIDLADSIRAQGVLQAITVEPFPGESDKYMIIAGERRWRASKIAGKDTIPSIIKRSYGEEDFSLSKRVEQLSENLNRENLNLVEEAEFIHNLIKEVVDSGLDESEARKKLSAGMGKSPSWISKKLAILKVSEEVRNLARYGKIRDYELIKKIDKLDGQKKESAIEQISEGTFNSKEFFKRKRYDNKSSETLEVKPNDVAEVKKAKVKKISFKVSEFISILEKTEFKDVLDSTDPNWRQNDTLLPEYIEKFREWAMV